MSSERRLLSTLPAAAILSFATTARGSVRVADGPARSNAHWIDALARARETCVDCAAADARRVLDPGYSSVERVPCRVDDVVVAAAVRCHNSSMSDQVRVMKKRKPQPIQKGNPHRLTTKQHIFPVRGLQRFANEDGLLWVRRRKSAPEFPLPPEDQLFCALRVWDQRAESGFMKACEDAFERMVGRVVAGGDALSEDESAIATEYWALWRWRLHFRNEPLEDHKLPILGLRVEKLTLDQREILEQRGVTFIADDFALNGRSIAGAQIQRAIDREAARFKGKRWGVVKAKEGEFILPDGFGPHGVIPVCPTILLVLGQPDILIAEAQVGETNKIALESAVHYVAARDFKACPAASGARGAQPVVSTKE